MRCRVNLGAERCCWFGLIRDNGDTLPGPCVDASWDEALVCVLKGVLLPRS